jgi:hypothetical protein
MGRVEAVETPPQVLEGPSQVPKRFFAAVPNRRFMD